jgi:hypothetical protein
MTVLVTRTLPAGLAVTDVDGAGDDGAPDGSAAAAGHTPADPATATISATPLSRHLVCVLVIDEPRIAESSCVVGRWSASIVGETIGPAPVHVLDRVRRICLLMELAIRVRGRR